MQLLHFRPPPQQRVLNLGSKRLQLSLPELEAADFADYFAEVYLGRINRNGSRQKPRFYVAIWNVYYRTIEHLPGTYSEKIVSIVLSMPQIDKPDKQLKKVGITTELNECHFEKLFQYFTLYLYNCVEFNLFNLM